MEKKFEYQENTKMKIKIRNDLNNYINGLDDFLKVIKDKYPNKFNDYKESLFNEYEKINNNRDVSKSSSRYFEEMIEHYAKKSDSILSKNQDLLKSSVQAYLSLANFDEYKDQHENEEIELRTTDIIRARNMFDYYQISSLLVIISREEAIGFIKSFIEEMLEARRNPDNYLKNLEGIVERFTPGYQMWQSQTSQFKELDEGKLILKVSRCEWADVMKGLDTELCYSSICNSDFKNATLLNPDFVLTRTKTLMQGDSYCDFCYHDHSIDKNLEHPSEQEFEKVN